MAHSRDEKPEVLGLSWALAFSQELPEASVIVSKN